jgi:uncharacterized protein YcfL
MRASIVLFVIGAILLTGCRSTGESKPSESCPGFAEAGSTYKLVKRKVSYIGGPEVRVVEMRCAKQGDLLRIDVDLHNNRSTEQRVAYRFDWFESNGMRINNEEAWKPLLLYPQDLRTIRTVSPGADAQDFRLFIKR